MGEEVIRRLENYNLRMKTAISELERLDENGDQDDFLDVIALSYGEIVRKCEHQREVIQRRRF